MEILRKKIELDSINQEYKIDIYGDTHLGSKSVAEKQLQKDIYETRDTGRHWMHLGDVVDGILPHDKRWNSFYKKNLADWAKIGYMDNRLIGAEWDRFYELFSPIKEQGLVVLSGDGKHNQILDVEDCFAQVLAKLGIPGGFPACFYILSFKRKNSHDTRVVQLLLSHGWFAGRLNGGKINNLERAMNQFPDVLAVVVGHSHHKIITRVDSLVVEGSKIRSKIRRGAITGSYLKTYEKGTVNYGEIKGYAPCAMGRITMVLRPFCKDSEKRLEFENV
jgi:hypothetical protein